MNSGVEVTLLLTLFFGALLVAGFFTFRAWDRHTLEFLIQLHESARQEHEQRRDA